MTDGIVGTEVGDVLLRACAKSPARARVQLGLWTAELARQRHSEDCAGCAELQRVIGWLEEMAGKPELFTEPREEFP